MPEFVSPTSRTQRPPIDFVFSQDTATVVSEDTTLRRGFGGHNVEVAENKSGRALVCAARTPSATTSYFWSL
jgi:hypothetical protein